MNPDQQTLGSSISRYSQQNLSWNITYKEEKYRLSGTRLSLSLVPENIGRGFVGKFQGGGYFWKSCKQGMNQTGTSRGIRGSNQQLVCMEYSGTTIEFKYFVH